MPNHCSAPRCKSNYRGEPYTPVFKLPTAPYELRTQWLNALHRDNIADLSYIYVCMHHFHPKDIITVDHSLLYIRPNSNLWILDQGWVSRYERKITGFGKFRENVMSESV